ncbi:MAG: hypothetical protein VXY93_21720, partial [Pseudomonadota bacterium]|nr:hypothetical protein [Pseudomonadota bacterium]
NPDYELYGSAGNFKIWDSTSNVGRLVVNSDGHVDIPGNLDCGAGIDVTGNITATGNVSGVDGTFTGNVSIGGTLTYEDVTNIDSVGVVTARNGINVSGGNVTIAKDLDVDGHTNLDNVSIAGLTTASQGLRVPNGSATSNYISVGNNGALRIWGTTHQFADIRSGNLHFRNNSL